MNMVKKEQAKRRERFLATVDEIRQRNRWVKLAAIEREAQEAVKAVRAKAGRSKSMIRAVGVSGGFTVTLL